MKSQLYTIRTITNMHVGSGNANYGIIDNLIQRDVVTGYPNINSSGFKGALREHCKNWEQKEEKIITKVFGSEPGASKMEQGNYRFFDCHLLALPARTDKEPYVLVTCAQVLNEFLEIVKLFKDEKWKEFNKVEVKDVQTAAVDKNGDSWRNEGKLSVEDFDYDLEPLATESVSVVSKLFDSKCKVLQVPNKDFAVLCDDFHLPVMARNCLETGKENLWYEQLLPRESILYTIIQFPDEEKCVFGDEMLVQIGANASIGYGFCKMKKI